MASSSSSGVLCPAGAFCAVGGAAAPLPCTAAAGYACGVGSVSGAGTACPAAYVCPGGDALPCPGVCDPVAWFDASTLALLDGAHVLSWADRSGGALGAVGSVMDAAAGNASRAPVYAASALGGGRPGVRFDGVDDALDAANLVPLGPARTFFAVVMDEGTTDPCCGGVVTTHSSDTYTGVTVAGGGGVAAALSVDFGGTRATGAAYNLAGRMQRVLSVVFNASGSAGAWGSASYVDGCVNTDPVPSGVPGASGEGLRLGARGPAEEGRLLSAQAFFKGVIAEVLVYAGALPESSRRSVEAYLLQKWPPTAGRLACGAAPASGACPEGTFMDAAGNCNWCDARRGDYCAAGSTTIEGVRCVAGSACAGGSTPAVPCLPGHFADVTGLDHCLPCVPGRAAHGRGNVVCDMCPSGTFNHANSSAGCDVCVHGGRGLVGAVACEAPAAIAVRNGGACYVQPTGDVACWGDRWREPFVLWTADPRARGGRSFVVGAAGVCLGDTFVGVLRRNGSVIAVGGDLIANASAAAVLFPGTPSELIWCGGGVLCARTLSGLLQCASVVASASAAAAPPAVAPLSPLLPAGRDVLSAAIGDDYVCVLAANGSAACGGLHGQPPPAPAPDTVFLHVASTGPLTCGIRAADRGVACWGAPTAAAALSPPPLRALCVGGDGLVCGLAWNSRAVQNDAAFALTNLEVCFNASSGASAPGAPLQVNGSALRALSCSGTGRCGVRGDWTVACDVTALEPRCSANYSTEAASPGSCYGVAAIAVDASGAPGIGPGDIVEVTVSRSADACVDGATVADGGTFYYPVWRATSEEKCENGARPDSWCMAARVLLGGSAMWDAAISAIVYAVGDGGGPTAGAQGAAPFDFGVDATRIGHLAFAADAVVACVGGLLPAPRAALVRGSWGPHPAPRVLSARANDTGGVPGLSAGDTIAVTWDRETNRAPQARGTLRAMLVCFPSVNRCVFECARARQRCAFWCVLLYACSNARALLLRRTRACCPRASGSSWWAGRTRARYCCACWTRWTGRARGRCRSGCCGSRSPQRAASRRAT